MVKFWLGGAFLTIFQDPPTFWPSDLYRRQSLKQAFLANLQPQINVPMKMLLPCEKIFSKTLRYGENKDNKTKWRLLNISATGWPIWTKTSPMGSILDILYRFRGRSATIMDKNGGCSISLAPFDRLRPKLHQAFWTHFTLSFWIRLLRIHRGQSILDTFLTNLHSHSKWKCKASPKCSLLVMYVRVQSERLICY